MKPIEIVSAVLGGIGLLGIPIMCLSQNFSLWPLFLFSWVIGCFIASCVFPACAMFDCKGCEKCEDLDEWWHKKEISK